jgi:hypothetical protein
MSTFNFPTNPGNGDLYTLNGSSYRYDGVKERWNIVPTYLTPEMKAELKGDQGEQGIQGIQGIPGTSLHNIELTSTVGPVKTYTIWGDAERTVNLGTFSTTDGKGISSTSYNSGTGVLTINFTDGTNFQTGSLIGAQGIQGIQGIQGLQGISLETFFIVLSEGITFTGIDVATIEYFTYAAQNLTLTLVAGTAPTGSSIVVDVNKNGSTILSTKISIDAGELNSTTSATPYVLTSTTIDIGDKLSIDVDQVGATVRGSNLQLIFSVERL